jgi:hypothetical protein
MRRIKMKGRACIIITMALAIYTIAVFPDIGRTDENEQLANYYKEYISKCISKNESKAALQTSRSKNLRRSGAIHEQKAVFLTNYQKILADEMIRKDIGTKSYKVDYYLNKRFNEIID